MGKARITVHSKITPDNILKNNAFRYRNQSVDFSGESSKVQSRQCEPNIRSQFCIRI